MLRASHLRYSFSQVFRVAFFALGYSARKLSGLDGLADLLPGLVIGACKAKDSLMGITYNTIHLMLKGS